MKNPDLMTQAELAEYLRVTRLTIHRLMKKQEFPFIRLGRRVLFRRSEIDAYLEARTVRKSKPI